MQLTMYMLIPDSLKHSSIFHSCGWHCDDKVEISKQNFVILEGEYMYF